MSTAFAGVKPRLTLSQIINMSVGFFGIQFGWDLQRANMGSIYENLGAHPEEVPLLFLAAPLTGLIVQPLIGYLSDRTWHPRWGRRRPYFLIGAILSSIALVLMPQSSALWMAAGLLWILDTFGNVAMEPFRAFVTDKLPDSQVNRGFVMQSLMIGIGGFIASSLPYLLNNVFHITNTAAKGVIADNVKWSFYLGAFFFLAAVLYTVFTTNEYPPPPAAQGDNTAKKGLFRELGEALREMPSQMKRVAAVQFFTWPALFLMWFYYAQAVAVNVFHGVDGNDPVFAHGRDFAGLTLGFSNLYTFGFSFVLPFIANKLGRKWTHSLCLACGALGLISVGWVSPSQPYMLYVSMVGIGIAWSSILSMPYAMLSGSLPRHRVGIYMGIFNFFIVLPEIIASLGFKGIMRDVLHNDRLLAIQVGGGLFIFAALLCIVLVKETRVPDPILEEKIEIDEKRSI